MIGYNKSMEILKAFLSVKEDFLWCVWNIGEEKKKALGMHWEMYPGASCVKNNST